MFKVIQFNLIALLVFSALSSCVSSRQILEKPEPRTESFTNNLDKDSNYVLANEWMVETFNDAESVIQFTDKESGTVKGKYLIREGFTSTSPYIASIEPKYAIITIRVKDNSCRIEIDPPGGEFYSQKSMGEEIGFTPRMFETEADGLIVNFRERMTSKSMSSDW